MMRDTVWFGSMTKWLDPDAGFATVGPNWISRRRRIDRPQSNDMIALSAWLGHNSERL